MSWKSLTDVYLQEAAGKDVSKLTRHQINESAAGDELVKLIQDLDSKNLLDPEKDVNFIKRHLSVKPYADKIYSYFVYIKYFYDHRNENSFK